MTLHSRKPIGRKAAGVRPIGRKAAGVSTTSTVLLLLAVGFALESLAFLFLTDDATTAPARVVVLLRSAAQTGAKEDDMCMKEIYGTPYKIRCSTLRRKGAEKMTGKRAAAAVQRTATVREASEPPAAVPEGSRVRCADEDDGDVVYRYTSGHLRKYPSPEVTDYWHEGQGAAVRTMSCAHVPRGPAMTTNNDEAECIPVVKCFQETSQAVYRYLGGTLRQYPGTEVADSWVLDWRDVVEVLDCADVRRGPAMSAKVDSERAVKPRARVRPGKTPLSRHQ